MRSRTIKLIFSLALLAVAAFAPSAAACPACSNLNLPLANPSLDLNFGKGTWSVGLNTSSTYFDYAHKVEEDDLEPLRKHDNPHGEGQPADHDLTFLLMQAVFDASYSFTDRIIGSVRVPLKLTVIEARFHDHHGNLLPDSFESIHHRDETLFGLGDMVIDTTFRVLSPEERAGHHLQITAGLSLPTARIEEDPYVRGRAGLSHQHVQFGSGTFDPMLGVSYSYIFEKWQLLAFVNGKAPLYENRNGYREGARYAVGLGAKADFGLRHWAFLIQHEYRREESSRWKESPAELTGRSEALIGGGVFWSPDPYWTLNAQVHIPYYQEADLGRVDIPFVFAFGVSRSFPKGG